MPQIGLSNETLARLKARAEPFVDKEPEDVIRRLLDTQDGLTRSPESLAEDGSRRGKTTSADLQHRRTAARSPRERGATVEIGKLRIQAVSVGDLYQQALSFLVQNHKAQLTSLLPFRTSTKRYLVADKPVHPSGNRFVVPVEYHGYWMEAHKDYKNGIEHLKKLARELRLPFNYLR